ncbi:Type I Iterative PKS [Penicillium cf. viridicatum]|uniref:Type I Iterative PKS n=1 Tax=Penicillium cf. viridicatum TaxID=2972119 RepID=A0A9W9J1A2_9EURO|nr:Type I Iterative PKS [Penicillium cf. viridicatum]
MRLSRGQKVLLVQSTSHGEAAIKLASYSTRTSRRRIIGLGLFQESASSSSFDLASVDEHDAKLGLQLMQAMDVDYRASWISPNNLRCQRMRRKFGFVIYSTCIMAWDVGGDGSWFHVGSSMDGYCRAPSQVGDIVSRECTEPEYWGGNGGID